MLSSRGAERLSGPALVGLVLIPFAAGHFLSYLYRTINAVLGPQLVGSLHVSAADLGLLTSSYFLAFAAMQLPVGMLLDRFGPRRVQAVLLSVAALGALLFARAQSREMLFAARALIGLGVAGSLMSAMKAVAAWVPAQRLPAMNGYLLAVGGLGAMASTAPVEAALHLTDWRGVFLGLAALTALAAAAIFFVVPDAERPASADSWRAQLGAVGELYRNRTFLGIAAATLVAHAAYMSVQGLWIGNWLHDVVGLPDAVLARYLFLGTGAMVAGSMLIGNLTQALSRRGIRPIAVAGAGIVLFMATQGAMAAGLSAAALPIALLLPFFGTATTLNYSIVAQSVPARLVGRATTSLNLLVFLAAFAVQWGIGALIGRYAPGPGGAYPAPAYRLAFGVLLALQVPGVLIWLRLLHANHEG